MNINLSLNGKDLPRLVPEGILTIEQAQKLLGV